MDPILIDIPVPVTTKRLYLRPPMPGDGPALNAATRESYLELAPWVIWAEPTPSVESSEINVRQAYAKWICREDLRLSIFDRSNQQLIGGSGLHRINWPAGRFEIGYWIRTSYAGKGLITEAVAGLTYFAFKQLNARRVEIRCDSENHRSRAIPERLGFELEARLVGDMVKPRTTELRDTMVYVRFGPEGLPDVEVKW
jgi:RimJ/RimL family protein N-acetyltransferase